MPGLHQTYDTLREEVGFFLGFGSEQSRWDAQQLRRINAAIREGVHKFLYNSQLGGKVYRWTFLRQTYAFTTASAKYLYDLPADFGAPDGPVFYSDSSYRHAFRLVNEAQLDKQRSLYPDSTGAPVIGSIKAKTLNVTPQGWELALFPTPNGSYGLRLPYSVNGEMLSAENLYPRGGPPVARALLLACKSEAASGTNGDLSLEPEYQASLMAAINYDAQRSDGNLGYNGDRSDRMETGYAHPQEIYTLSASGGVSDDYVTLADL